MISFNDLRFFSGAQLLSGHQEILNHVIYRHRRQHRQRSWMRLAMHSQSWFLLEFATAHIAHVRLDGGVRQQVLLVRVRLPERIAADLTIIRLNTVVHPHVSPQASIVAKCLVAYLADDLARFALFLRRFLHRQLFLG